MVLFNQIKGKKMKKVLMSVLVMGAMTVNATAGCIATGCNNVQVTKLYMTATGTLYVGTDGTETSLACGGVSGLYMSLKEGDVGKSSMYSLLLTAQTTGKRVTVRIEEGSSDCRVAFVKTL